MDPDGAKVAIDQLYGKAVAKHSKPLFVEVSQVSECSLWERNKRAGAGLGAIGLGLNGHVAVTTLRLTCQFLPHLFTQEPEPFSMLHHSLCNR
jgi:hypothetical protein